MATTMNPFTLGKTAIRVFNAIHDNPGSNAREISEVVEIEIGQVRMVLRNLRKKEGVLSTSPDDVDPRMIRYAAGEGSMDALQLGITEAAERKAARGVSRAAVEPMEEDQFREALLAVARYDILITRYTGLANRDKRESEGAALPVRHYELEGESWQGTASELVKDLRSRRAVFASLPEYRAALKIELDQLVTGGDIVDAAAEAAA